MARLIFYDLSKSPYSFSFNDLKFIFSSEFYLCKFINDYQYYIDRETLKINYKYNTDVKADEVILIDLYKKIEKRGFKVYYKDKELKSNSTSLFIIDYDNSIKE